MIEAVIVLVCWWALGWLLYRKYPLGIRDAVQGGKAFMLRRYGEAELDRVPGIGPGLALRLRPLVTVR